jgi:hypothetical protein
MKRQQRDGKLESTHVEELADESEKQQKALPDKQDDLLRDRHGFVLMAQPSRFKDDPLVSVILVIYIYVWSC